MADTAAVEKITASKGDYYAMLGVEKDADERAIEKAYKKLSLKVHPDKNKAAGADEAFKLLGSAYQTLRDPTLKRMYDNKAEGKGGDAPEFFDSLGDVLGQGGIFRAFPSDFQWARRPPPEHADHAKYAERNPTPRPQLIMAAPLLTVVLSALACWIGVPGFAGDPPLPEISLSPAAAGGLPRRRQHPALGIPYWVSESSAAAAAADPAAAARLDRRARAAAVAALRRACHRDRATAAALQRRGASLGGPAAAAAAEAGPRPRSCAQLGRAAGGG
eukprot:TRINITY_DN7905_c0_g1_i1.p1 TRINITY_DN7905_c0_g1~~TRINITY_DN7905_c0_g1_i1.p1  ORF type:complete len:305 (+),score=95.48 TRINITY_DN7905_c0_g1_i1:92-916(+)